MTTQRVTPTASRRSLARVIPSMATSDGAGVKLRRSIGSQRGEYLDPFLMLDEFGTDNPGDYIAGFPPHPHRGFETVTYMLDGRMRHEDHLGNVGDLGPGGVQWMTAGRGVIHSEMPLQESGRMRGFQLWLNLPQSEKMKPAAYRDIAPDAIPSVTLPDGNRVTVIAGTFEHAGTAVHGPVNGADSRVSTDPLYLDVVLGPNASFDQPLPADHTAFVYVYEGALSVIGAVETLPVPAQTVGVLSPGDQVLLTTGASGARFLLLAARPLGEPVVQYGPFVMTSRTEIEQAIRDYQQGVLTDGG